MKKKSLWLDTVPCAEYPPLAGRVSVDVAVVGAGITGLTAAYLLKKEGRTVAVLDQQNVGQGETAHTTAHLTFVTDARLSELAQRLGKDAARTFWESGVVAMNRIEAIAAELGVECELQRVPGFLFAALGAEPGKEEETLRQDAILAAEFDFEAEMISKDPVFGRPAIRFPNQLKFHPLKYLDALARAVEGDGSYIFGRTCGSNVTSESREIHAGGGVVAYGRLVAATHAPIQGERGALAAAVFQTKLAAYSTYAIEADPGEFVAESLFWDTNDPYYHFRFDRRGQETSVILGGEDHKTGTEDDTENRFARLEKVLGKRFPKARPVRRWSGQVLETPDGLPYIGEAAEHQYLSTGYSGNGITLGTFGAMLIADLIAGRANPAAKLFAPGRSALKSAGSYLRENLDFPLHFFGDRLRPPASPEDVRRNSGALVRIEGKRSAV